MVFSHWLAEQQQHPCGTSGAEELLLSNCYWGKTNWTKSTLLALPTRTLSQNPVSFWGLLKFSIFIFYLSLASQDFCTEISSRFSVFQNGLHTHTHTHTHTEAQQTLLVGACAFLLNSLSQGKRKLDGNTEPERTTQIQVLMSFILSS